MGCTEAEFLRRLPLLEARGFPKADPTTGNFDLDAIDEWRRRRHPQLFLTPMGPPRDARRINIDARLDLMDETMSTKWKK